MGCACHRGASDRLDENEMNDDRATEGAGPGASERGAERVCVVIWDGSVPKADLRPFLGDALPLHFVRWQDRSYLAAIDQLRPSVIVAVEPDDELASDVAGLLACLVTSYTPTIVGMTLPPRQPARRRSAARLGRPVEEESMAGASDALAQAAATDAAPVGVEFAEETSPRTPDPARSVRLLLRQLGPGEGACIGSLADVVFG
jgi:hypothetical protein